MSRPKKWPHKWVDGVEMRYCPCCNEYLSIDKFYPNHSTTYCRVCQNTKNKEYKARWLLKQEAEKRKRGIFLPKVVPDVVAEPLPPRTDGDQVCRTCKSFSQTGGKGWCMRKRRVVPGDYGCEDHREEIKVRYVL